MTSAYMSLETLAVTLDMPPREVKRLVAHNMLPQPIQIGGHDRWSWYEVEAWIKGAGTASTEDPMIERARRAASEATSPRSHHQEQDGQTVHLLPNRKGNRSRRAEDQTA